MPSGRFILKGANHIYHFVIFLTKRGRYRERKQGRINNECAVSTGLPEVIFVKSTLSSSTRKGVI